MVPAKLSKSNLEGKPFFTCKVCGGNIVGVRSTNRHIGNYCCSKHHNKGNIGCLNNARINRIGIEKKLLSEIECSFGSPDAIDTLVKELNSRINGEVAIYNQSVATTQKELDEIAQQIETTFLAMSKGIDAELCNERLVKLKYQRVELTDKLEQLKRDRPQPLAIDPLKAQAFFLDIRRIYNTGTNEQKRTLFKTYIRNMVFDPESGQVNVVFYPHYLQKTIESGYGSPLNITSGAGSGT